MKPIIILVAPQMGENIGAAARAMKNFGLKQMRIVSPRDGWPNEKADSMSVGAIDIIKSAKIYDNLANAVADLDYVYATTGVPRDINKNYILSKDISSTNIDAKSIGIIFGRENSGLTNEEIAYANSIITIDTNPEFSSMNIAHAVAIVSYEFFKSPLREDLANEQILCTKEDLEYFFAHLFEELDKKNFFKIEEKKLQMTQNIRAIFNRIDKLSKNEIQALRGIINALTKSLTDIN
ncbi:MAG UNVERIFIED_CONTAM: RNA methyltransferase [Planctomycetaceae bacterium]|jgi:tRNA/rRNA methyltransferase